MDDRLSELPDSLIHHVLSFLTMRDVVKTSLLSKRWENLWTTLPCLDFYDIISQDDGLDSNRVRNFVNRVLISWKGTMLMRFKIDIEHIFDMSLASDMNLWVCFAVGNKVEVLNIRLRYDLKGMRLEKAIMSSKKDVYWAPRCLNSCSSIRKLSLVGCNLRIPGYPAWDQLKRLKLHGFCFSERMINRILLGTPRLEVFDLRLIESNENLNIRSTSLKKLKIEKFVCDNIFDTPSLDTILRICCPNLETLEISGVYYCKCLFTNVSSLTNATLGFAWLGFEMYYGAHLDDLLGETMRHVFSTFQHVEKVALSFHSFQMIGASQRKYLFTPLPNVVFLKVEVRYWIELVKMVHLLEIFPNLNMLVIENLTNTSFQDRNAENCLEIETNLSKSFLLQLKIVEISSVFSNSSIFRCIEFLLKHGSMLEELVIQTKWFQSRELQVAERLLSMPRSSPMAKVIFNKK